MRFTEPTLRQRRLNQMIPSGDWYAFFREKRRQGDSLETISRVFGVSIPTLQKWVQQAEAGRPTKMEVAGLGTGLLADP